MIYVSITFFLPLTFLSLRSLPAVSNSFNWLLFSYVLLPLPLCFFLMQPCIATSVFLTFLSPPLSVHLFSFPFIHLPSFHISTCYSPISSYNFLHSNLHSQFINSSVTNSPNSHNSLYQVVFANVDLFSVSANVSSAFM